MKYLCHLAVLMLTFVAANAATKSGTNKKDFNKYWRIESEAPDYTVDFSGDTVEIWSPKGLTLWRKEKMTGDVTIEYDACVVMERDGDRLSDLNCFWMASDPEYPDDILKRANERSGIFTNCYALQLYYLGYGGNHNSTTRFRRYTGDERGITDASLRPGILKEYTDSVHLNEPNRWRHIKLTRRGDRVQYFIDGECLVDYKDPEPLEEGWFGFRTTLSRTRLTNFSYTEEKPDETVEVPLHWIGDAPSKDVPATFGVPFKQGEVSVLQRFDLEPVDEGYRLKAQPLTSSASSTVAHDFWPLAYWPDGSVKWLGIAKGAPQPLDIDVAISEKKGSSTLVDSISIGGVKVAENMRLICNTQDMPVDATKRKSYISQVDKLETERAGEVSQVVKISGTHRCEDGSSLLPFIVRIYTYTDSRPIKIEHTIIYDGDCNRDFINALGLQIDVPMREAVYNRHIAFATDNGGVWSEPVKPLVGRRVLRPESASQKNLPDPSLQSLQMLGKRIMDYEQFDSINRALIDDWADWDGYRLSQPTPDGFTIRKRATDNSPWIGTDGGHRAPGYAFLGDVSGGIMLAMDDFWESYPSSIEINGATTDRATLTAWLWSPEAEPMDLRHYDDVAHGLNASYEDVQPGMSTPYGIARTSTLFLIPSTGYTGKTDFANEAALYSSMPMLMPTPEYLHSKKAFGIWSLPDRSNAERSAVEDRLDTYIDFYKGAIEQNRWYGFWNYGDVMHAYDPVRHCWRYDVGGYAWDNTELASNMWLWYNFLRTGRADIWRMALAMARHTGEVDVYHIGEMAGLGSRHNVSHWGCGAKEARISQAAWNRFLHFLAADARSADLMDEVTDADLKLYDIDPMRLAQPRDQYPCTAPARLRIGPDWLAYAGNWMSRWERTQDTAYRDKIAAGMRSICALPSGMFTGPKALGYDPATGVITTECDSTLQITNHLMTIMGGFEVNNELMEMMPDEQWQKEWLNLGRHYKHKALELAKSKFRVSRPQAYAAYKLRDPELAAEAWNDLLTRAEHTEAPEFFVKKILPPEVPAPLDELNGVSTNDAALWSLDAIYMQEVIGR